MGFQLEKNATKIKNFRDDDEVQKSYYKEVEDLLLKTTGAKKVFIFDHTVRKSSVQKLNNLGAKGEAAGSVVRVHCDYTSVSAPRRFKQLGETESYTGFKLTPDEVEKYMEGRYAFINVWRPITEHPVYVKPLAVCDTESVDQKEHLTYELRYAERTGETYSLAPKDGHKWYYYPQQEKDECLIFKVFDKKKDGPRFTFHTAFEDPSTPADAPARESIEVRAIVCYDDDSSDKAIFFDMIHSNNAARIRLWLRLKGLENLIESRMITYPDLQSEEFKRVNPLKKVPAFINN